MGTCSRCEGRERDWAGEKVTRGRRQKCEGCGSDAIMGRKESGCSEGDGSAASYVSNRQAQWLGSQHRRDDLKYGCMDRRRTHQDEGCGTSHTRLNRSSDEMALRTATWTEDVDSKLKYAF